MTRFEKLAIALLLFYVIMLAVLFLSIKSLDRATNEFTRALDETGERPIKMEIYHDYERR